MHTKALGEHHPISGRVLEVGPGGNVAVALLFLEAGADSAVCIDVFPWAQDTPALDREVVADPEALYPRLTYRCPDAIETTDLPSESFDLIYSHACLEHVQNPNRSVAQIARLLRPGGVTTHQIDLRDHRDFTRPLEFLKHSERAWRWASSHTCYTNRWRASDWVTACTDAGLEVVAADADLEVPAASVDRRRLHRSFASRPLDDLTALSIMLVAVKPTAAGIAPERAL